MEGLSVALWERSNTMQSLQIAVKQEFRLSDLRGCSGGRLVVFVCEDG